MKSSDSDKEPCLLVDKLIKTKVLYYFLRGKSNSREREEEER